MGMLNKQKNIQIAAMNASGMTVEAIARKAGVDVQAVKESLEQRGRDYIELAAMSEVQKREYIANLQNKGKSVSEIACLMGLNAKKVNEIIFGEAKEEPQEAEKSVPEPAAPGKRSRYNRLTELIRNKIIELKEQGKSNAVVAKELGIGQTTVYRAWTEYRGGRHPSKINEEFDKAVDEMIEESKNKTITEEREEMPKAKEPAPAATDTSSTKNENKTLSTNNDIIDEPKSQALNGVDFIWLFEDMLHEGYGDKAKIVKVIADKEKASVVFECEGRAYGLNFGLAF